MLLWSRTIEALGLWTRATLCSKERKKERKKNYCTSNSACWFDFILQWLFGTKCTLTNGSPLYGNSISWLIDRFSPAPSVSLLSWPVSIAEFTTIQVHTVLFCYGISFYIANYTHLSIEIHYCCPFSLSTAVCHTTAVFLAALTTAAKPPSLAFIGFPQIKTYGSNGWGR